MSAVGSDIEVSVTMPGFSGKVPMIAEITRVHPEETDVGIGEHVEEWVLKWEDGIKIDSTLYDAIPQAELDDIEEKLNLVVLHWQEED